MDVVFQGQYTSADVVRAVLALHQPAGIWRFLRPLILAVAVILYASLVFSAATSSANSEYSWARVARHSITLLLIVYWFVSPYVKAYGLARKVKQNYHGVRVRGILSARGVELLFSSHQVEDVIPWQKFYRKRITADIISLLTLEGALWIFPRSFFQTDEDWKRAQELVRARVAEAR